eukprot:m.234458 g.234458  ORF g.234458 m.234458 type:complete len:966 (+) comp19622_c0_seq1:1356-4253(+)
MSLRSGAHPFLDAAEAQQQSQEPQEEYETTPLHYAAATGNSEALVQYLHPTLLDQIDLNGHDTQGKTALIYAVVGDHYECVALLLQAGADVLAVDTDRRSPVHWAAFHGRHRILKLLLENGGSAEDQDKEGRTALHLSTGAESSKCTKLLMKYMDPAAVNVADEERMTAAHWSAFHDHAKHLDLLIGGGADLLLADSEGRIALHWTATNPTQITCNLILVSQPLSINVRDSEGRTALHLAVANNNIGIVDILTSADDCDLNAVDNMRRTPLHWAAVLGFSNLTTLLLQRGADSAVADDNGGTAMHYAAQLDNSDSLLSIVSYPGVKDVPDLEGRTALMWAAGKGQANAIEILALHQGDLQAFDKAAGTALHIAAFNGHEEAVKVLLKFGASVDALDSSHHTPLFRACEAGHLDVVEQLLSVGASVDLTDSDGRVPMHWAALGGFEFVCLQLGKAHAAMDPTDHHGRTPLQCATYGGHITCMAFLLQQGANVNSQDIEGITPLHWACSIGNIDAVRLLLQWGAFPNHMEIDGEKLTPLDYIMMGELKGALRDEIVDLLVHHGALSIASIKEMAATSIQAWWRGVTLRISIRPVHAANPNPAPPADEPAAPTTAPAPAPLPTATSPPPDALRDSSRTSLAASSKLVSPPPPSRVPSTPRRWQTSPTRTAQASPARQSPTRIASHRSPPPLTAEPALPSARLLDDESERDALVKPTPFPRLNWRPSSACRGEILQQANVLKRLALSEKARLAGIRRMMEAAMIIQLAWRRYQVRKQEAIARAEEAAAAVAATLIQAHELPPVRPLDLANNSEYLSSEAKDSWRHQIAALTIQLAWRQYRRRKLARQKYEREKRQQSMQTPWAPSVMAQRQRERVHEIYGRSKRVGPVRVPQPPPMARPAYMRFMVPAGVASFNFALGSYLQPQLSSRTRGSFLNQSISSVSSRTPRGRTGGSRATLSSQYTMQTFRIY